MSLIATFQDLVSQVPDLVQPLIVTAAAAVPFIEGEGATTIGIVGGVAPVIAALTAILGNFLCVTILVLTTARARQAVVARRAGALVGAGAGDSSDLAVEEVPLTPPVTAESRRKSARRAKFQRAFERYGVPGVSLLGPLLIPTHFTATMLAAAGVGKQRILLWQAVAITGWTALVTALVTAAVAALV